MNPFAVRDKKATPYMTERRQHIIQTELHTCSRLLRRLGRVNGHRFRGTQTNLDLIVNLYK